MEEIILSQQPLLGLPIDVDTSGGEAQEHVVGLLGSLFWSWQAEVFNDVSEGETACEINSSR